jgi:hypothetical protein
MSDRTSDPTSEPRHEHDETDLARAEDALVALAAEAAHRAGPDGTAGMDAALHAALYEWLARDARLARPRAGRRAAAREARRFADVVLARRATERVRELARVRELPRRPRERPAPVAEPLGAAVERAGGDGCAAALDLRVAAGDGRALWDQACERWVTLPAGLPQGRYLAVGVAGDSMLPLLAPGDTLLVRLGAAPAPGAIVVARGRDDGYVVKQVGRVTARTIELRSLNPAYRPFRVANGPSAVLGVVVVRWRGEAARGT